MLPGIGILGLGYLGQEVVSLVNAEREIWATQKTSSCSGNRSPSRLKKIIFQWNDPATWNNLPTCHSVLILTIPPLLENIQEEQKRLQMWGRWLNHHRPNFKRCIYISSTGVYPNLPGLWDEQSLFESDSPKGQLRHISEKILGDFLDMVVIRSGAIYGRDRNIGRRILAGKAIPSGNQTVHRIHVHDLARLVHQALDTPDFPPVVNAVDLERETTKNVAEWLTSQPFFPKLPEITVIYSSDFQTRKFNLSEPNRQISNLRMVQECQFEYRFPTYREGLAHAFTNSRLEQKNQEDQNV